ncbi:MAG TPA: TetR/AcrR family transcriptional regulator [Dehalococcoidia bacterium]|nr:TetR/AcrR family transcriptional regulator [Dehalococcoidia bacterium]
MDRTEVAGRRRSQLIEATIEVMARKGWQHTSISEVTKEAGVSRGLASYHFKDKADLLSAVLRECRTQFTEAILAATADGSPSDYLRNIIRLGVRQIREAPGVFQVFLHFAASAPSVPELGDEVRALWRDFRGGAAQGIRTGQAEGAYRSDVDADAAAAQLIGSLIGLAWQWLLDPGGFDLDTAGRLLEEQFVTDLTRTTAASEG